MRWLVFGLMLAAGCATAPPTERPGYEGIVLARVQAKDNTTIHLLRYNPTGCRCPAFEVALGDHWHRVELEVDDIETPALTALRDASTESGDQAGRLYEIEGALSDALTRCGGGVTVIPLALNAFRRVVISPPPESEP